MISLGDVKFPMANIQIIQNYRLQGEFNGLLNIELLQKLDFEK